MLAAKQAGYEALCITVAAAHYTAVEHNVGPAIDRVNYLREHIHSALPMVKLTPAMI